MAVNPFPGPQPYGPAERGRFFAREDLAQNLIHQVRARSMTIVFGASGSGKSSLIRASILPSFEESGEMRIVHVETWPADQEPLAWLVGAMFVDLDLGQPDSSPPLERLKHAFKLATEYSDRPLLLFLDQTERLFTNEYSEADITKFLDGLVWLIQPERDIRVHVVLAIREDYVGRFHDWTRDRPGFAVHGFHVRSLSVGEMVEVACKTAALGTPSQSWLPATIKPLMLDMRVQGQRATDNAAIQAAFAQIVCRALWDHGMENSDQPSRFLALRTKADAPLSAEAIVHKYLDDTLKQMGLLQKATRQILEEHFIDQFGHRRLLTEGEAEALLPVAQSRDILYRLEHAVILTAKEHQGSRYFELGHDWLARKLLERRLERLRSRKLARIVFFSKLALVPLGAFVFYLVATLTNQQVNFEQENRKNDVAKRNLEDATRLAAAHELYYTQEQANAAIVLSAAPDAQQETEAWRMIAEKVYKAGIPQATFRHTNAVYAAAWNPVDKFPRVVTGSHDGTVKIWDFHGVERASYPPHDTKICAREIKSEGAAPPPDAEVGVSFTTWNPGGNRIFIGHSDGSAEIWDDPEGPTNNKISKLKNAITGNGAHEKEITSAAWSPVDEKYVATTSKDGTARLWTIDPQLAQEVRLQPREFSHSKQGLGDEIQCVCEKSPCKNLLTDALPLWSATWRSDGQQIATAGSDGHVLIWDIKEGAQVGKPVCLEHDDYIYWAAWSSDDRQIAAALQNGDVVIWKLHQADTNQAATWQFRYRFRAHKKQVWSVAWRPKSDSILTASNDRSLRIWHLDTLDPKDPQKATELSNLGSSVWASSWSPDGTMILVASEDNRAWIWDVKKLYERDQNKSFDSSTLFELLHVSTSDCLTVDQRMTYLSEPDESAILMCNSCEKFRRKE